mgnify:CR=1 FL=1
MEENVRSLLAQECFYFRTSLNWAVENELTLDKCLLVMVERGKASVFVGENEYTLERNQILFMRPELPLKKLRSTTDFSVSLMAFPPSMLRDSTERMEPRFLLLLFTQVIWGLDAENRKLVEHFRELFRFAVADYGRGYTRELVLSLVNGLVYGAYEMCGAARLENLSLDSSRSRELFRNFMELLHEHLTREHEVQFYAGKLCISSKYLTQVSKGMIGRTPKQIIDETLMHEAMKLLDKNNSSIQDISVIPRPVLFRTLFQAFETHVAPAIPLEVETLTVLSISKSLLDWIFIKSVPSSSEKKETMERLYL